MFLKFFVMLSFIYSFSYADAFLDKERLQALKEKKLILLSISSDYCPYWIKMKKNIFDNVAYIQKISRSYVHVTIMNHDSRLPKSLHVKYLPTQYILSPKDLKVIDEFAGYMEPNHFMELLDEVYYQEIK